MLFSEINIPTLQIIQGTECIGDSLYKINTNTLNLSSYIEGIQSDVRETYYQLQNDVTNASSVLTRIQSISSQTDQWNNLFTYTQQSSSFLYNGYNAAVSAIPNSTLLGSSALRGVNAYFTTMSATNLAVTTLSPTTTLAAYISSRDCAVNSLTASGFLYGNGSKLTGIIAPTRVYLRFNGKTISIPDGTPIASAYWGTNFNVSSITKISTGLYRINFARSIESPSYAYFLCSGGGSTPYVACRAPNSSTNTYDITVVNKRLSDQATVDAEEMNVLILYPQTN